MKKTKDVIKRKIKTELKGDISRTFSSASSAADDDAADDDDEHIELTSISMSGYWGKNDKKGYDERREFLRIGLILMVILVVIVLITQITTISAVAAVAAVFSISSQIGNLRFSF